MRTIFFSGTRALALALAALAPVAFAGCGKEEPAPAAGEAKGHDHDHDHDHGHGHKHEGHVHVAPHGGTLVVLGDEFAHLEFKLDPAEGRLTAYSLDAEAENSVRLTQPTIDLEITTDQQGAKQTVKLSLDAVGSALTGETPGDTSEFSGAHDALKGATAFDATVSLVDIRGQKFNAIAFNFPKGNE